MASSKGSKFAVGALIGAAVGFLTGILTAPKSGKETRADIREGVSTARDELEAKFAKVHEELNELIDTGKQKAENYAGKARDEWEDVYAKARTVQSKVATVAAAVKSGEAADPDLERARKEAEKAVTHLRSFFKK